MSRVVRCAPALALMGLIYFLSAQPDLGTGLEGWDFVLRKLGHMAVFGTLFVALVFAFGGRFAPPTVVAVLYAASDEFHQSFVVGRHGTAVDVLIDCAGIATAWALVRRRSSTASRVRSR